ncbi:enoyl-CoA hydratase-related protein [Roseomonas populi]|uniref:Enoyl-CoA hydratase-related protein n=1 Tax=Roseomonas populi TaxID=3121582 RepID=A0ABT1X3D5_9PROT|nr:enoyl-CoA hydratase-related protein [Roseomonas pecuniae]MCR0982619.1 enoyl-CoA hydratase-related protein [Roseomonas pecuniae]
MSAARSWRRLAVEEAEPGLLIVRFNRPEVRNAIDTATMEDLRELFGPLAFTPGGLRCIVLTGTGDKAFCAGGDLKERQGMSDEEWRLQHAIAEESAYAVLNSSVPVIAAVNGAAFGGGCELALCCDFIYAASTASFALPEVTRGIMPGAGGTQNLPRAVGERRAKELLMTGRPFSAAEAERWGMVNEVCEPEGLMPRVMEVARTICANAPISVRQIRKAVHQGLQTDLTTGLLLEVQAYERTIPTEDRREGVRAFNERRRPVFQGR